MIPSVEVRAAYVRDLRARTTYPTIRKLARGISILLYVFAGISILVALVAGGMAIEGSGAARSGRVATGYSTLWFVLLMLIQAIWLVVLGRVVVEVTAVFTDAADCLIDANLKSVIAAGTPAQEHASAAATAGELAPSIESRPIEPEEEQLASRLFERAAAAAKTGDRHEALRLLRSVLQMYPGTEAARKAERSLSRR